MTPCSGPLSWNWAQPVIRPAIARLDGRLRCGAVCHAAAESVRPAGRRQELREFRPYGQICHLSGLRQPLPPDDQPILPAAAGLSPAISARRPWASGAGEELPNLLRLEAGLSYHAAAPARQAGQAGHCRWLWACTSWLRCGTRCLRSLGYEVVFSGLSSRKLYREGAVLHPVRHGVLSRQRSCTATSRRCWRQGVTKHLLPQPDL